MKRALMWFRSDLRIADNPALSEASKADELMALYCLASAQWDSHGVSKAQRSLIVRQLFVLQKELEALNIPLIILNVDNFQAAPVLIAEALERYQVEGLFFNAQYELNEDAMTRAVSEKAGLIGCRVQQFHDQCLIQPGRVVTVQGQVPKVYSAFKRRFLSDFYQLARPITPKPKASQPSSGVVSISSDLSRLQVLDYSTPHDTLWPAGESEAFARLERFAEQGLQHYQRDRDHPMRAATSTLSPYLAVGILSTAQCIHFVLETEECAIDALSGGAQMWVQELIWREFYRHTLWSRPDLCRHKPFKPSTDLLPWSADQGQFEAWKAGRTGYPLVDAAMRQLKQTAWMHNRLRMVVAMFLTKHLNIDWRLGEAYFMSMLVDGDFASNNGGWQWSASTGVDATPYFRIFNPIRQSERFDESGEFIRKFVPELKGISDKRIHNPSAEQRAASAYPQMMVDHARATTHTKSMFKALAAVSN